MAPPLKADPSARTLYQREYRARNPERVAAASARYREANRVKHNRTALNSKTKARLGISIDEADAIRARPCASCGTLDSPRVVDHNHDTGEVRGPLCHHCNTALGLLNEDPDRMFALAAYVLSFHNVLERMP